MRRACLGMDQQNLFALGALLRDSGYAFAPVPNAVIKRYLAGPALASPEEELFGWRRAIAPGSIPAALLERMERAGVVEAQPVGKVRSKVAAARIAGNLILHDSGPGAAPDAVFAGPDTSRFIDVLRTRLGMPRTVFEVGCGAGAAAIWLAQACPSARVVCGDINQRAILFSRINGRLAGVPHLDARLSDGLDALDGNLDLVVCNPPFVADPEARTYRDGGGDFGMALPARIVREAVERLAPGGRLLMYTASPVIKGRHVLGRLLGRLPHHIDTLDTGQFDDLLGQDAYQGVDEIQTVALSASRC